MDSVNPVTSTSLAENILQILHRVKEREFENKYKMKTSPRHFDVVGLNKSCN